jgi:hypothetical protein
MVTTPAGNIPGCGCAPILGTQVSDASHWWGQDLSKTTSGDIQLADSIPKDNQRIFRRLCTNGSQSGAQIGEYVFHPTYGGSAPWYVGQATDGLILQGVIRSQMYQEASVVQNPEPDITITFQPNGAYQAKIKYTDVQTLQPVPPLLLSVS